MFHRSLFFFFLILLRGRLTVLTIYLFISKINIIKGTLFEFKTYPRILEEEILGQVYGIARIFFLHPIIVDDRTGMKRGEKSGGNRSRFNVFRLLRSNSKMHTRDACIHAYSHYPPIYHATPAK